MERQKPEKLVARRLVVLALVGASFFSIGGAMAVLLGSGGWSLLRIAILGLFLIGLPWTFLAFWNSLIGFAILRLTSDPAGYTNPALRTTPKDGPITARTAICLAMRHENVARVFARLETMIASLDLTELRHHFAFHLLSDSTRPEIATAEERAFANLRMRHPAPGFLHYRRRATNTGFKAGNIREFAERTAGEYDFMIVLDADSLMSGAAILRLVRVMQANPTLGILQSLVVGLPAQTSFARIFQFGMRHAMRLHTLGIAWWQGPSGPYWGHNAIIRLQPFIAGCRLPVLRGCSLLGGHVLSHDQVEAALMRSAGFEVRVIAEEFESWEETPPRLPDFIKRDLRWCQGNIQYIRIVARPNLRPMGRFHLLNAIFMYLGAPCWVLMIAVGLAAALLDSHSGAYYAAGSRVPSGLAFALYFGGLGLALAPRVLGVIDTLLQPAEHAACGGAGYLIAGATLDAVFSLILGPIMMVGQTLFILGLTIGRRVAWEPQNREEQRLPLSEALRGLWPQLLFGVILAACLAAVSPGGLPWATPTIAACALAVPFAWLTAHKSMGSWMAKQRLCATPDESTPTPELRRLQRALRAVLKAA